ncbi:hypothetical protein [Rufibacter sp. LB8]|uniref:hypothetical protein n=1 Tax=Rufibacter sp. LB8 TaxID=2777781 RepID=UPI00178C611F|nr:hypothetical protein [Rufibacter sp. LB8]
MANETNKNRDDRNEKLGKPETSNTKASTNEPINGDTSDIAQNLRVTSDGGGRKGGVSSEDGGQEEGSSAGSH